MKSEYTKRIIEVSILSIAFAFVESSVVVYLRGVYYPQGFSFPLRVMSVQDLSVELVREFATMVMLVMLGGLAGTSRWQKFAYFLVAFGVWDIFYYIWLKVILNWPRTLFDWDILFLIPLPWIAPVIAPVMISLLMIVVGVFVVRRAEFVERFQPPVASWLTAVVGTGFILYTFLSDTQATLQLQMPQSYRYDLFLVGIVLYIASFIRAAHKTTTR